MSGEGSFPLESERTPYRLCTDPVRIGRLIVFKLEVVSGKVQLVSLLKERWAARSEAGAH